MAIDLSGTIAAAANEWNLDPALLHAVAQTESGAQANGPDSPAGAMGPLQVMPGTASDMGVTNPRDPVQNTYAGAKYLSGLLDKYGDPQLALAAYNAGPGRVDDYLAGKAPLPAETTAYVPKVASAYAAMSGGQGQATNAPGANVAAAAPTAPPAATPSGGGWADAFSQLVTAASAPSRASIPPPQQASPTSAPADDPFSSLTTAVARAAAPPPQASGNSGADAAGGATAPAAGVTGSGVLGAVRNGLSAFGSGAMTAANSVANTGMRGAAYVDSQVPALAGLDRSAGLDPAAGTQSLDRSIQQADQANAGSPLYTAGKIGGDLAFTLPVASGLGAAAGAAGEALGVPTVANALAGSSGIVRGGATLARNALAGAGQGITAAGVTAGGSTAPIGQQLQQGAEDGAVLGAAVPALVGAARGATSAVLGGSISPETAALAQTARDQYGIPLQASQISGSPFVRFMGDQLSKLPFSGAGPASAAQSTAMNRAIAGTFGETADRITPEVMQAAKTRLGSTFDSLASQIPVQADDQLLNDLGTVESNAHDVLVPDQAKLVSKQISNVLGKAAQGNGIIDGNAYQALTAKGGVLDNAMSNGDPGVQNFAGQVRTALDAAMQRSAPPELAQQLSDARLQYKNLMTVAPLAAKAQGTDGNVSPVQLLQAVRNNFSNMAFQGGGQLGELATIGQRFMKPPPDSGTATRNMIIGGLGALTPSGLAAAANEPIGALGAAAGTLGTVALGRAAGAYLRSPFAANRLIANGLAGNPTGQAVNALAGNAGVLGGIPIDPSNPLALNPLAVRQ